MPKYAPFGNAIFGETVFGPPPSGNISATLTVLPIGYTGLSVSWVMSGTAWSSQVLLRSSYGTPTSIYDGDILLDESGPFSTSYTDNGLRSGLFYYYALFVYSTVLDSYVLAGAAQGLVLSDYGFGNTFTSWIPNWYLEQDSTITTSSFPQGPGPLTRFLSLLGYEMDWMRSEIESFSTFSAADYVSGALLPYLGANYGMTYEPELGMRRSRVLVKNAVYLYKTRGTHTGIAAAASAFSGYGCAVTDGKNLEIQLDDCAFDQSVGHWVAGTANVSLSLLAAGSHAPPHVAYNPVQAEPGDYTGGYLPPNTSNILQLTISNTSAVNISTCTSQNAETLGIPIPVQTLTSGMPGTPTPPTSYVLSAYFQSLGTVGSFAMQIDWYDLDGVLISSTTGTAVSVPNDGVWHRAYVVGTPPEGGTEGSDAMTFGRTVVSASSAAGSYMMDAEQVEGSTQATPSPTSWEPPRDIKVNLYPIRQNLITNPVGLNSTYGWSGSNVTLSALIGGGVPWPAETTSGFSVVTIGASNASVWTTVSVNPNVVYTFSCYMLAATAARTINLNLVFYTSTGTAIYQTATPIGIGDVLGSFTRVYVANITAPVNAATMRATITVMAPGTNERHYLGAPMIEPGTSFVRPYFDANFAPATDYLFEGTPNASISDYYPNLVQKLSRLSTALPDYVPIGSTFSLCTGATAFAQTGLTG